MAANVQLMCQYWKNFDLLELQRELDTTATELANRQDESEGSRKRLVEQSREFKKNTPEDIRKVVAPLLKSFQLEIDSLSKRSKAAEAAFLSVYKKLIDLPDPCPTLEHAQSLQKKAHKVQDLEIENKQLRETLDEYNHEFAEVKNQEVTIKQLKEKLKEHEERVEATAQNRAKEKERELQRAFAEKERQLQETQLAVARKLGEAEQQITSLHRALETAQSELFEVKAKYDEATSAKSDEMEIVMADLERANERAASAERQVERLKQQLALAAESLNQQSGEDSSQQASASEQAMDILKRSTLEVELASKEKEIAQLVEDVQRLQASLNKLREMTSAQVAKLEEELSVKNKAFRVLEDKLRTQEDYEEVKRELRVLKSIEFANVYIEESHSEEGKSLEMLLLDKNKYLQTENTHLKVVNSGLTDNIASGTQSNSQIVTTTTTTSSTTKKSERFLSLTSSSSSLSPLLPSSPSSATVTAAMVLPASATPVSPRGSSQCSSNASIADVAPAARSTTSDVTNSFPALMTSAVAVKQEASSPASSSSRATPQPSSTDIDIFPSSDLPKNIHRVSRAPSRDQQSPNRNCKLSPDSVASSQLSNTSNGRLQPPVTTSVHSHLDPRLFASPMSSLYAFPSSPFHPAFMPLNMVKSEVSSTTGALDTSYVAKTVRELLSLHNIGQRLFAKHVLGLSQGTVSELLSKPKSWDKLTEKGRESYRKMHTWATDDANVVALKAISPKKGTHPVAPNNSYKEKEDSATEERIANILIEAHAAMHVKKNMEQKQVAHAVVSSIYHQELSRMGGTSPGLPVMSSTMPPAAVSNSPHYSQEGARKIRDIRSRHHSNSSHEEAASAQEMVARIYRQELEKLKKAADVAGNIAASAMYAQELDRLNSAQNPSLSISSSFPRPHQPFLASPAEAECPQPSPLALDCRSTRPNGLKLKTEPPDSTSDETTLQVNSCGAMDLSKPSSQTGSTPGSSPSSESGPHAGSAFFLVHPQTNGHDSEPSESPLKQHQGSTIGPTCGSVPPTECLSPLQRMQNIANSFTSRPGHAALPNAKPLRAVLPPIIQEDFDRYTNMNTDDLVKKIKETLSQYSISQRLFGESVLGLSQGSVSDLLARPKPWHMLTQKGREPFIRMQLFLEDAESIPKLLASQYRIPPDKLMRSNSRGSNEPGHRRRKTSMDDRNFDSPTQPKRPRVFFTEEQKDSLRVAYNQDPYPNQGTIEALAKNLNVGVKTVINWFHNHRMRAKQQHHGGGDASIKSEMDESSNQSDISSMSGDVTSGGHYFHGGITPTDVNQWLFPHFESAAFKCKVPSGNENNGEDNKENNGSLEDDDGDEMDEPDGLDNTSNIHGNHSKEIHDGSSEEHNNKEEDKEGERNEDVRVAERQQLVQSRGDGASDNLGSTSLTLSNSNSSVSRRKRSNPQRIYEGLHHAAGVVKVLPGDGLVSEDVVEESTELGSVNCSSGVSKHPVQRSGGSTSTGMNTSQDLSDIGPVTAVSCGSSTSGHISDSDSSVHRNQKIQKIQKAIKSAVENWDEDDEEQIKKQTASSIEKIQKYIETKSGNNDWEF